MKSIVLCLVSVMLFLVTEACHQSPDTGKQKLSVLYVGDDPRRGIPPQNFVNGAGIAKSRYEEDMKHRMEAFVKLLEEYFENVKAVDVREYREEMTKNFDVIVFDALPAPVVPGVKTVKEREIDMSKLPEETRKKLENVVDTKELFSARYFSDHYSKPTLIVGDKAGIMGAAIGLKLNWFCRCLDAHAFDVDGKHPIFQGPLVVDIKYEKRIATSSSISGVEGVTTPGVLDMWRVQTEGYREGGHERYRQGLVAHGDGFEENQDAEKIAGGGSDKGREAVAIGRHGNFFMWGFAADPGYMTEQGKRVFINAICYISKFDGQMPVARKYANGWVTREKMRKQLALFDPETFAVYTENTNVYNRKLAELKLEVNNLNAAREVVPGDLISQAWPQPRPLLDREAFLEKYLGYPAKRVGCQDVNAYRRYLEENMDYFYGGEGDFTFSVDTDLKQLGIGMGNIVVLDRAIELLGGSRAEKDMGERLLKRYTSKDYTMASEWMEWLKRVRGQLRFTESCGYKFIECGMGIDTCMSLSSSLGGVQQENPVTLVTAWTNDTLSVTFKIKPGFHIYSMKGEAGAYVLTQVEFRYPEGIRENGELIAPAGKVYEADEKVRIYENEIVVKQPVVLEKGVTVERVICIVTYQACDNMICLPPVTEEFSISK